jgi:hypothetical protein
MHAKKGGAMSHSKVVVRKHLNADALFEQVHTEFEKIPDGCEREVEISVADALKSGFAMFSLKDPSLLAFDQRRHDATKLKNLQSIYHIGTVPCDTQLRVILDQVYPEEIAPVFGTIFRQAQRGKALEKLVFWEGCYLLSVDGTQYFTSKKIHCPACLQKTNANTGEVTYSHQLLAAAIVHPDAAEVIPVCPEPIQKQDGETKNDCERNAAKRFLARFRRQHPHLRVIVTEDGLSSNAPHIRELLRYDMHFILGAKPGDHAWLFEQVEQAAQRGETLEFELQREDVTHRFRCLNTVALNESNQDVQVNFLEYWEVQADGTTQPFSWVTDIPITRENAFHLMRGGRARWKIENETFNTLKNQGYHFEHNYGHGQQNLSVIFALLMMLAFLVDQVVQLTCRLFQAVWRKEGSKIRLWEHLRALFYSLEFPSMVDLFKALLYGYRVERVVILE